MKTRLTLLLVCTLTLSCTDQPSTKLPPFILDTDCGPDYDDVGALAVMFALEKEGLCEVKAVISSNKHELVIPTIAVINTYYKRGELPLGEVKGEGASFTGWHKRSWSRYLVDKYKPTHKTGETTEDAVTLYRRILSQSADKSVIIGTIGFLTNLSNLLNSQADNISPLTGRELVAKKVKRLVTMGGRFPAGNEYNIRVDVAASINVACTWPTDVYLCGEEIGEMVFTGKPTSEIKIENSPTVDAYRIALSQDNPIGRQSWDQLTVLAALKGTEPWFSLKRGTILIDNEGKNRWKESASGRHHYMVPQVSYEQMAADVEQLMMYIP